MARQAFGRLSEAEYSALLQALSSTSKGRAFLEEYRQRSQPGETLGLLDSLHRFEASMETVRDQLEPASVAEELRRIAMSLDIALEGAEADEHGDETARRFALTLRARGELGTLASTLAGGNEKPAAPTDDAPKKSGTSYRLRDPASER